MSMRISAMAATLILVAACGGTTATSDGGLDGGGGEAGADGGEYPAKGATQSDKIDLLLMVDNSTSMGDKQELLAQAVPVLVQQLVGQAPKVMDLHVGLVTSSLGGGGADICAPDAKIGANEAPTLTKFSRHNDDHGHLVARKKPDFVNPPAGGVEDPVADVGQGGFLAWLPAGTPKPPAGVVALSDATKLTADFVDLVRPQEFGCGLEAQLESWYRFLIQPDPYDAITLNPDPNGGPQVAALVGVDATVLQQRADFLRPDSAVVVLVVTDEEDSWSDPMWLGGRGWLTRGQNNTFSTTGQLPRGTSACDAPVDPNNPAVTGPNDPACQWCALKGTETDPNCQTNKGLYGPKEDGLNVRYTDDMKRRYGMTAQFPISRYVDGLLGPTVPDRRGEHFTDDTASAMSSPTYLGRKNCTNPLYAKDLPTDPNGELCHLARGPRGAGLVFFGVLGGVPPSLLSGATPTQSEWIKIVGKDPGTFQIEGIDPHMIESIAPRAGIACGQGAPSTCDPVHGREWNTLTSKIGIDRQYACTFTLPKAKDCTKLPEGATCDCGGGYGGPLCDPNPSDGNNLTLQTRGKSYPTIRELRVARAMGDQGLVGSICAGSGQGYAPFLSQIATRVRGVMK